MTPFTFLRYRACPLLRPPPVARPGPAASPVPTAETTASSCPPPRPSASPPSSTRSAPAAGCRCAVNRARQPVVLPVALFVLKQVFFPLTQGSQYYLVIFLAVTLPLASSATASGPPSTTRSRCSTRPSATTTRASSTGRWPLVTLVVGLYPVLPIPLSSVGVGGYEGFLDRQGTLLTLDVVAGHGADGAGAGGHPAHHRPGAAHRLRRLLRLRLLRRLPADRLADLAHRASTPADRQRALQRGQRLLRHTARRRGDVHRAVHDLRRRAGATGAGRFFVDLSFALFRKSAHRAGPHGRRRPGSCSARCPAPAPRPR